jgi:hypothetical protein
MILYQYICGTFRWLEELGSSQEVSLLEREDDCVLQLIDDLVQPCYVPPGHLQTGSKHL